MRHKKTIWHRAQTHFQVVFPHAFFCRYCRKAFCENHHYTFPLCLLRQQKGCPFIPPKKVHSGKNSLRQRREIQTKNQNGSCCLNLQRRGHSSEQFLIWRGEKNQETNALIPEAQKHWPCLMKPFQNISQNWLHGIVASAHWLLNGELQQELHYLALLVDTRSFFTCKQGCPLEQQNRTPAQRRHLPRWESRVCYADISSVTVSQTNMSPALDGLPLHFFLFFSWPLWMCLLLHSERHVLAGCGRLLKYLCYFSESRCSLCAVTCTGTLSCTAAIQRLGSLPIVYQAEAGRVKYFVWNVFSHLKSKVLFPGFTSTFMGKVCFMYLYGQNVCFCLTDWSFFFDNNAK